MHNLKEQLFINIKNLLGFKTKRKIVVFAVDDYGNIRLHSKKARERLIKAGINLDTNRFDKYDALDTAEDLAQLFDVLTSVKDINQRYAVFTPYALSANIDFEKMEQDKYEQYYYESLPDTLNKINGYEGTWNLWQEGIKNKIFMPQFHGREHLNVKLLEYLISQKNPLAISCLKERSWAGLDFSPYPTIDYVSAFSFWSRKEQNAIIEQAVDGLNIFNNIFGYRASNFNAPGTATNYKIEIILSNYGIKFLDTTFIRKEHFGNGNYKYKHYYHGKINQKKQIYLIRNCVYEPTLGKNVEWIERTMKQIEIAFKWNKPAIISSHRVNFCGHIDPQNRKTGLRNLKILLNKIVTRWKDIEFMAADELGRIVVKKQIKDLD